MHIVSCDACKTEAVQANLQWLKTKTQQRDVYISACVWNGSRLCVRVCFCALEVIVCVCVRSSLGRLCVNELLTLRDVSWHSFLWNEALRTNPSLPECDKSRLWHLFPFLGLGKSYMWRDWERPRFVSTCKAGKHITLTSVSFRICRIVCRRINMGCLEDFGGPSILSVDVSCLCRMCAFVQNFLELELFFCPDCPCVSHIWSGKLRVDFVQHTDKLRKS